MCLDYNKGYITDSTHLAWNLISYKRIGLSILGNQIPLSENNNLTPL
jgi:hypothetical protein